MGAEPPAGAPGRARASEDPTDRARPDPAADDNEDIRRYIARLLERHYEVRAVADGAEALKAALSNPPDLVLSDAMMPRLDGFGLLKALPSWRDGSPWSSACAPPSASSSSFCTTSRRCCSAAARFVGSRRCCAGTIRRKD